MNAVTIRRKTPEDVELIGQLMDKHWGGEPLVVRGKNYYPSQLDGLIAIKDTDTIGFLFYEIQGTSCEIVVLEALDKFKGIGTTLLNKLKSIGKEKGCHKISVMTTNDNLDALRFYQRRGFHLCGIHVDSMKTSREMKPGIPMIGDEGIPLRDEIDLEMML